MARRSFLKGLFDGRSYISPSFVHDSRKRFYAHVARHTEGWLDASLRSSPSVRAPSCMQSQSRKGSTRPRKHGAPPDLAPKERRRNQISWTEANSHCRQHKKGALRRAPPQSRSLSELATHQKTLSGAALRRHTDQCARSATQSHRPAPRRVSPAPAFSRSARGAC